MSFSFDGANAAAMRPPHIEPGTPGNWARDERRPGLNDGTRPSASLFNEIAANLRGLVTGAGLPLLSGAHVDADTMMSRAVAAAAAASALAAAAGRNMLINPSFAINQRVFAGGALAADVYGYDRWKGGAGGGDVTAVTTNNVTTVTLASGRITQVVEADVWGSLAGRTVVLSVESLTGNTLTVEIGDTATGVITPGSGRRGVALTLGAGETGNINVRLRAAAGSLTFRDVQLELGLVPSQWSRRSRALDDLLALRYYQKSYRPTTAPGTVTQSGRVVHLDRTPNSTTKVVLRRALVLAMRAIPTITWYSPLTGAAGMIAENGVGDHAVASTVGTSPGATGYPTIAVGSGINARIWLAHVTADAEL